MTAPRTVRRPLAILVVGLLAMASAACTALDGSHPRGSQPVGEACAVVDDSVQPAMTAFGEADARDPAAAADAAAAVAERLEAAVAATDNDRVDAAATRLADAFRTLAEVSADAAAGDLDEVDRLPRATDAIRSASAELADLCAR